MVKLFIEHKIWPVKGTFRISRSALTEIHTVWVTLQSGTHIGRGECRPYARYGDSVDSVIHQIENIKAKIEQGLSLEDLQSLLPAGPARNAVDCAMWDLRAKQAGKPVYELLGVGAPKPRETAFTLSKDTPEAMAAAARDARQYTLLKVKVGCDDSLECVQSICKARPDARLIVDANEALAGNFHDFYAAVQDLNIALIEQPLPAGMETDLPRGTIPICADESLHIASDISKLKDLGYRALNVKLDKCGGLSAALDLMKTARKSDMAIMAGCMVASSLAMAPMMMLESFADYIDLDGPLLLAKDCDNGIVYDGPSMAPPRALLWG